MNDDRSELLSRAWIFSHLTEEQLQRIGERCRERVFRKGQVLFYMGDQGGYLYVIKKGAIKVIIEDEEAREVILSILREGEILGDMTLIDGSERSATAITIEETRTLMLAREDFLSLVHEDNELAVRLLILMSSRIRRADRLIWELSFVEVESRLARILLDLARKEGIERGDEIQLELRISRQELAALIGASREATSRALKKLQERRLISISGRTIAISKLLASVPVDPLL